MNVSIVFEPRGKLPACRADQLNSTGDKATYLTLLYFTLLL